MADAQATFVATLDSSGVQSGARGATTALQRMGAEIQKRSKDLAAMKAVQARLQQSAGVQEYLKRQKAIEKQSEAAERLGAKLSAAQENLSIAKQANVSAGDLEKLTASAQQAQEELEGVQKHLAALNKKQDEAAASDKSVEAFRDQSKVIKSSEQDLAQLQAQYSAAGGDATDLGEKLETSGKAAKKGATGIEKFLEEASGAGGPIGELAGKAQQLQAAFKAAGAAALVAVLALITVAAYKAIAAMVKLADATRNATRARSNAAFGAGEGAGQIEGTMKVLRENTALSKEEAQGLASELYRLGDRGKQLEETALTIERFGQLGDDAKQSVKGLYEELRKPVGAAGIAGGVAKSMAVTADMLPRDVFLDLARELGKDGNKALVQGFTADKGQIRAALANIGDKRFAGPAIEQMRSLDSLAKRWDDAKSSLFDGLKIGTLLGGLQKLVDLLDESSESGKAIRLVLGTFMQPVIDIIDASLPVVKGFFEGMIIGALGFVLGVLKVKNAISDMIPESVVNILKAVGEHIDVVQLAIYAGVAAFALLAVGIGFVIGLILSVVGEAIAFGAGIVALGVIIIAAWSYVADNIGQVIDDISAYFADLDLGALAGDIIDGLVNGLKDGASALFKAFTDLAKGGYQAFKDAIFSKSPSKLFRMAGRTIPQGVALGVEDDTPQVTSAVSSMASPDDMTSPNGARGGGGVVLNVAAGAVVIQVHSTDELLDESFGRRLLRQLAAAAREGGTPPEPETA
jgi:formylmethanofuran dehydrogenase subunit D